MEPRAYCSQLNPDEPLAGTADWVGAWLMLEYRPVWKAKANQDNSLAPDTRAWLDATVAALAAAGIRARPQFVRQPEREAADVRVLFGLPDRLFEVSGASYDHLHDVDLVALARGDTTGARQVHEPRYFVCTNGQRDLCCARFGLPVYAALRERVGDRAWQITHLGGHRFAPNVLTLPHGALYGRVQPADVATLVDHVERGELAMPYLRGTSFLPQHVQAAECFAGRSGLRLLHVDGGDARARVRFVDGAGTLDIEVTRTTEPLSILASCGDVAPGSVFPYRRL